MNHPYGSYTPNRHLSLDLIIADVERQVQTLGGVLNCTLSPDLDWVRRVHHACPAWVEKFFVTVPWQTIAPTYVEAVIAMLHLLKQGRDGALVNFLGGKLTSENFRECAAAAAAMKMLNRQQQSSSTLIVPGQLGLRHRDRSVYEVRSSMSFNEFGFGVFVSSLALVTHSERAHCGNVGMDCAGDEIDNPMADNRFCDAPYFYFGNTEAGVVVDRASIAHSYYGSATGFVPQL